MARWQEEEEEEVKRRQRRIGEARSDLRITKTLKRRAGRRCLSEPR